MAIQQHVERKYRFAGFSLAMGLLMPVSILFAESPLAVDVPLDPDGVQRVVVEADSYEFIPHHLVVKAGKPVELTVTSLTMSSSTILDPD